MPKRNRKFNVLGRPALMALVVAFMAFPSASGPLIAQTSANNLADETSVSNDAWHVSISPYLWMAGLDGSIGFGGHAVQVNQSFSDIFQNLKFGVMGFTEVRRRRIGVLTDLMYIRLGNETAIPVGGLPNAIDVKTSLNTFTLTPYLNYRIFGNERGAIDIVAGARYYHIGSSISAEEGSVGKVSFSTTDNWADYVEGGRFRLNITPRIRAFFIGDAGVGGSVLSWQIVGGVGYNWSKRWSGELGYRRLYFNRQTGGGLGIEQTQQGLVLGVTFRPR